MKKQLLGSALSSLEDSESLYTSLSIEEKHFHRYKDAYGYSQNTGSVREYYKEGYLYIEDFHNGNYKVAFHFDTKLYLQKEAENLAITKEIIELCNNEFKLKDKGENGEIIIFVDKEINMNGNTRNHNLQLTFIRKS